MQKVLVFERRHAYWSNWTSYPFPSLGSHSDVSFPSFRLTSPWNVQHKFVVTIPQVLRLQSQVQVVSHQNSLCSAVYTGIKKPESFSHSGFLLKAPKHSKKPESKNPPPQRDFLKLAPPKFQFFCQCKRSLQSRRYYSGFWSRGTWPSAESPDRSPRHNAHYTCTVKGREKSRMRTTYQKTGMRFRFFRACAFRAKKPECYGFFWQCKRYNNKNRFFGFWFLPM